MVNIVIRLVSGDGRGYGGKMLWVSLAPTPLLGIQPSCPTQPLPCGPQSHLGSSVASVGLGDPTYHLAVSGFGGDFCILGLLRPGERWGSRKPSPAGTPPLRWAAFLRPLSAGGTPAPSSGHDDVLTCEIGMKPQDSSMITAGGSVWWEAWV